MPGSAASPGSVGSGRLGRLRSGLLRSARPATSHIFDGEFDVPGSAVSARGRPLSRVIPGGGADPGSSGLVGSRAGCGCFRIPARRFATAGMTCGAGRGVSRRSHHEAARSRVIPGGGGGPGSSGLVGSRAGCGRFRVPARRFAAAGMTCGAGRWRFTPLSPRGRPLSRVIPGGEGDPGSSRTVERGAGCGCFWIPALRFATAGMTRRGAGVSTGPHHEAARSLVSSRAAEPTRDPVDRLGAEPVAGVSGSRLSASLRLG